MKYINKVVALLILLIVVSSCSSTQKFTVNGTPGTKIYTPKKECIGTIPSDGKLKMELPSDGYYAYMLSNTNGSDLFVPFALDYKKCNREGVKTMKALGVPIYYSGLITSTVGFIVWAANGSEAAGAIASVGAAAAGVGGALGIPAAQRMEQTSYDWNFKYLGSQSTNEDMAFTKPMLTSVKKKTVVGKKIKKKQTSEKTTKTFKNYAAQIEGTYVGSGKLSLNGKVVESYSKAIISIERVDNETVCVNVEEGGALFFDNCSNYKIKKTKNGYTLTHKGISKAVIKVKKNGEIEYYHPKVIIDGLKYSLSLVAKVE